MSASCSVTDDRFEVTSSISDLSDLISKKLFFRSWAVLMASFNTVQENMATWMRWTETCWRMWLRNIISLNSRRFVQTKFERRSNFWQEGSWPRIAWEKRYMNGFRPLWCYKCGKRWKTAAGEESNLHLVFGEKSPFSYCYIFICGHEDNRPFKTNPTTRPQRQQAYLNSLHWYCSR